MAKPHRQFYWHVPIPYETFMELSDYMHEIRSRDEIGDLAGTAIRYWLADERRKLEGTAKVAPSLMSGYQWKRLFLPDGTRVRTVFKGRPRLAQVTDSQLVFEGANTTPHEFANAVAGAQRNAWKTLWLLFPGEREWRLADDCRPVRAQRTAPSAMAAT